MQTDNQTAHAVSITQTTNWYADLLLTPTLDGEPDERLLLIIAADAEARVRCHDDHAVCGQVEYQGQFYEYQLRIEFDCSDLAIEASL